MPAFHRRLVSATPRVYLCAIRAKKEAAQNGRLRSFNFTFLAQVGESLPLDLLERQATGRQPREGLFRDLRDEQPAVAETPDRRTHLDFVHARCGHQIADMRRALAEHGRNLVRLGHADIARGEDRAENERGVLVGRGGKVGLVTSLLRELVR